MTNVADEIIKQMNIQMDRIETCLQRLSEQQIWQRVRMGMNRVGNLCIHLAGNEH
jgi:hypothetical protein